jgi:hypothetical protein
VSTPPIARSVHAGAPRFSPKNLARTSATPTLANSDPSPGAHLHHAEEHDVEQQPEQSDVDEMRFVGERSVVDREHDQQRDQTERDRVELCDVEARRDARRIRRRAVDHDDAQRAQREDGGQQRPVDMVVKPSFEQTLLSF